MTFPKARLVVSLCLFLGWLGFLGYLVYERNTILLSQPQFAVAQAIVIARISDDEAKVMVEKVEWCANPADEAILSKELTLPELLSCGPGQGYQGKGAYVIPLTNREGVFQIAPVQTPGSERTRSPSHGTLRIVDGGEHPERVLQRLVQYAKEKPRHAEGLTVAITVPIVECVLARIPFPQTEPKVRLSHLELPRRLPLADANVLAKELKELGATIDLRKEELRIYPVTSQIKAQLGRIVRGKNP